MFVRPRLEPSRAINASVPCRPHLIFPRSGNSFSLGLKETFTLWC